MSDTLQYENLDDIKRSFGRCLSIQKDNKKFIHRFYEIFINSHPNILPLFRQVDLTKQIAVLKYGINMAILYADNDRLAEDVLKQISETHNRYHLNIKPNDYFYWVESMIQAIEEYDPKFNPDLEEKWRYILQITVDYIKAGY